MTDPLRGIHHVTAIAASPRGNLELYREILGLRLVKRTVNFDDPGTWHLYYGDEEGAPGTLLTFFPWPGARRGEAGAGQVSVTSLAVPAGSLGFWRDRLLGRGVTVAEPVERFGAAALPLRDGDGLALELVEDAAAADRPGRAAEGVPERHAVRGVHSVTLRVAEEAPTAELLTDGMGFERGAADGPRRRFGLAGGGAGTIVDLLVDPAAGRGRVAAGSVHHVAFRAADEASQSEWRRALDERGLHVTPPKDRRYFRSIYFREPGGVLFEIATDGPGFTTDEPLERLGDTLRLPPWLEEHRERIESVLPPLEPAVEGAGR